MDSFCPACGKKQKTSAIYCNECGVNMSPGATRKVELLDNRYQVESIIKSGNMGCVYRVVDTRLGETVVVKKMQATYDLDADGKKFQEMFLREAKLLAKLHHGGLPKVMDYFTEKDSDGKTCHYLVMTFIEGMDMECYLKQNIPPLSFDEVIGYFRQILDIFSYLHSQTPPVIYRDLKPSNIMIKDNKLYLVDFGIAKTLKSRQKGTMWGTPGYASPDQGRGNDSPLNDIYSLGVLIHYLFTGIDPEDPSRPLFAFEPARNFNKNVPESLDNLIMSMVDMSSVNRPGSVDEILEILDGGGGQYPTTASALTPTPAHAPPSPSHYPGKQFDRYDDFFEAVKNGRTDKVEEYINQGADVNAKNKRGQTPLGLAAEMGNTDVVRLLKRKKLPLGLLALSFFILISLIFASFMFFKLKKANVNVKDSSNINAKDSYGRTPLHNAAGKGETDTAKHLISKGASISARDNGGRMPLHYAATKGETNTAELLISKGASVNSKDNDARTPLHHAAGKGETDTAKLFISKGASVNSKDNYGAAPLHYAAGKGRTDTAKLLISNGASIDVKDNGERTPLHYTAKYGKTDTAKLFISKGADVNAKDNYGMTPLKYAVRNGHTNTVNLLRKYGERY
ncbi:MAG: ankyrin repeat domain-containing protein [Candidatus Eremiobacteraeota bacterium]|nr:ankyrin repeat domain-containing protein [Candidatus Eremiobacteraeota bacterium]